MLREFKLSELQALSGGHLVGEDIGFANVSIDSRACERAVFVALKGEHHDAHAFAEGAKRNGALALVVERELESDLPQLVVKDSREALGWVGALNRSAFQGKLISLTGSSGKTTTKNMLSAILERIAPTNVTQANQNNEIGVPLTLLSIEPEAKYAVLELGARHIGDIAYLGRFVKPDVTMVINAGCAHLGEFGGYDNIVKAKGEIYEGLSSEGIAVLNADDPACEIWQSKLAGQACMYFSVESSRKDGDTKRSALASEAQTVIATELKLEADRTLFNLVFKGESAQVELAAAGAHNVQSATAAAAAALACGVELDDVALGLSNLSAAATRLQTVRAGNGATLLDDSYNANPVSMRAAIDVLAMQAGHKHAALGEMGELGADAEAMHLDIANYLRARKIDSFWGIGPYAKAMSDTFGAGAHYFERIEDMSEAMSKALNEQDIVLIKGSRCAGLERLVQALEGRKN